MLLTSRFPLAFFKTSWVKTTGKKEEIKKNIAQSFYILCIQVLRLNIKWCLNSGLHDVPRQWPAAFLQTPELFLNPESAQQLSLV